MTQTEITTRNIVISEFIGPLQVIKTKNGPVKLYFKPGHNTPHCQAYELGFNESWDWLMPIVELLSKHKYEDGDTAYLRTFGLINQKTGQYMVRINRSFLTEADTLIESTFLAVSEFISSIKTNGK